MRSVLAGEIIQIEGEECQWVGFVQKGALRVFRRKPNGREQVLHTIGQGMHFNAIFVIMGKQIIPPPVRALKGERRLLDD